MWFVYENFKFFVGLKPSYSEIQDPHLAASDLSWLFSLVSDGDDLHFLEQEMARSTKRAILLLVPIHEMIGIPRLLGRGYFGLARKSDDSRGVRFCASEGRHWGISIEE